MKRFVIAAGLALMSIVPQQGQAFSFIPSRTKVELSKLYSGYRIKEDRGIVKASGPSFNAYENQLVDNGNSVELPIPLFTKAQEWGKAVLQAIAGDDSNAYGTAFHVGGNLVLTNQHVLSVSRNNTTECESFRVYTHDDTLFRCEKVHYCNASMDYCLIQMKPTRRGIELASYPSLDIRLYPEVSDNTITNVIGNPQGFGLHFSSGRGIHRVSGVWRFYAPLFHGNSGGPVLNENGDAIGLVRAQSRVSQGEDAYNVAVPLQVILEELRLILPDNSEALSTLENQIID